MQVPLFDYAAKFYLNFYFLKVGNIAWLIKNCLDDKNFNMQRSCNGKSYCSIPISIWDDRAKCRYKTGKLIELDEANKSNIPCYMYNDVKYFLCKRKNQQKI